MMMMNSLVVTFLFTYLLLQFLSAPFSAKHGKTVGAMDMGRASTEMSFIPENPAAMEPGYSELVRFRGENYTVYSHSYPCYGLNEAYRRYLAHLVQVSWVYRCVMYCIELSMSALCLWM